jgi:hypothetical protein
MEEIPVPKMTLGFRDKTYPVVERDDWKGIIEKQMGLEGHRWFTAKESVDWEEGTFGVMVIIEILWQENQYCVGTNFSDLRHRIRAKLALPDDHWALGRGT